MRTGSPLVLLLVLAPAALVGPAGSAPAQLPPAGSVTIAPPVPPAEELTALGELLALPGEKAGVRYPPEALDRAARVQARLHALVESWEGFVALPYRLDAVVLRRSDWDRAGLGGGWGAPLRIAPTELALPAEGDAGTVAFARALTGGALPDPGGVPVMGSREEAGSLVVVDLLLQLEAARATSNVAPLFGDSPWVTGVLIQLLVRHAWERWEPEQLLGYVALYDAISAVQGGPRARRLADYREGLSLETEIWYQAQFVRGADAIWVDAGPMSMSRRLYRWARKREPVTAKELEKKYPALVEWERAAFAP